MIIGIVGLLMLTCVILLTLYLQGYFRQSKSYQFENFPASDNNNFGLTVASLSDSLIASGKIINFWVGAEEIYAARLEAIQKAQSLIQVETYIMTPGHRADEFAQAIIDQTKKKIKVQLLVDDYGTQSIPNSYWKNLINQGIEVRKFNQFNWRNPLKNLRRNHRKLLIIDNKLALIGGAGISDHWDGWEEIGDQAPWLDYEVAVQGNVLARLSGLFWQHWLDTGGVMDVALVSAKPINQQAQEILITANDYPTYQDSSIRALFQTLILGATQRLWIASPYFLPNSNSCKLLRETQTKGVDVRILTMGKHCDKAYVRYAARERYHRLLKTDISLYEYQPSMMHAKIVLVDNQWVSFGSANFDPRSFFQNDELNLSINDGNFIEKVEDFFIQAFQKSQMITVTQWQKRPLVDRLIGSGSLFFYWQL